MSTSQPTQEYATPQITTATKLRRFFNESTEIVVAPGVYDGFSAHIALQVGFDALYMVSPLSSLELRRAVATQFINITIKCLANS